MALSRLLVLLVRLADKALAAYAAEAVAMALLLCKDPCPDVNIEACELAMALHGVCMCVWNRVCVCVCVCARATMYLCAWDRVCVCVCV